MNGAQLHLLLNHFPVIVTLVALLVVIAGLFFKTAIVVRTGLYLGAVSAVLSIPAYLTGEPAEHFLKEFMNVTKGVIHSHEEFAETAFIALLVTGVICLGAIWTEYKKSRLNPLFVWISLSGLLISFLMMGWTAHLGGLIRHEELREAVTTTSPNP